MAGNGQSDPGVGRVVQYPSGRLLGSDRPRDVRQRGGHLGGRHAGVGAERDR